MATEDTMLLAPGYGCIPERQRNAGYKKLGFKPGEGGLGKREDPVERMGEVFAKALSKALAPLAVAARKETVDGP